MENLLRKKIRGNETVVSELDTEGKAKTSKEDSSQSLLVYDVLRIIFTYLNGMDLSSASMVCRSWLEAANNEKRTRGPIVSEIPCCEEEFGGEFKLAIKELSIKPVLGLFFRSREYSEKTDCSCKVLPPNYTTIRVGTYGNVYKNKVMEHDELMTYAFLPDIPNTIIKMFTLGESRAKTINLSKTVEEFGGEIESVLGPPGQSTDRSKCLLLFCTLHGRRYAMQVARILRRRYQNDTLAVCGGVGCDLSVCDRKHGKKDLCYEYVSCTAVVLSGAIQTWSFVIDKKCNTKEKVERRFKSLKSQLCLKKHSIGLMFACCGRGGNMFDEFDVESTIFKNTFPEVPLVGGFGDGEFGANTILNESGKKDTQWYNETSTVVLILTYD